MTVSNCHIKDPLLLAHVEAEAGFFSGQILHVVDQLSYFSFQPVLHDWCDKGRGMCNPVCGMVHIKEPLLSERVAHVVATGFISQYLSGLLPYVWRHKTVK